MKSTFLLTFFTGILLIHDSVIITASSTKDCSNLPSNVTLSCSDEDRPDPSMSLLFRHRVKVGSSEQWCGYTYETIGTFNKNITEYPSYKLLECELPKIPACAVYKLEKWLYRKDIMKWQLLESGKEEGYLRGGDPTVPPVKNLQVTSTENRTMFLKWNSSTVCTNVRYNITYTAAKLVNKKWKNETVSPTLPEATSGYTISGTLPSSVYKICVVRLYQNFSSDVACEVQVVPGITLSAPDKLRLLTSNYSAMKISWQSPVDLADVYEKYYVSYDVCDAHNTSYQTIQIPVHEKTSGLADYDVTLIGLLPGTKYCISVKGVTRYNETGNEAVAVFSTESDQPEAQDSAWLTKRNIIIVCASVGVVVVVLCVMGAVLVRRNVVLTRTVHKLHTETMESRRRMYFDQLCEKYQGPKLEMILEKELLISEYQQLDELSDLQPCTAAIHPQNAPKNRPMATLPYDHSRVVIRTRNSKYDSDYINASHIPNIMNSSHPKFIAAQSPMSQTVLTFWQMIWEQKVNQIVMIAQCVEDDQDVCARYFPIGSLPRFKIGSFVIFLVKEISVDSVWYEREIIVTLGTSQRELKHFQYNAWPTPSQKILPSVKAFSYFVHAVRTGTEKNVVVTHCNTGSGRTGVFLALWNIQLGAESFVNELNVTRMILEMRKHRRNMVENKVQFFFLNKCCRFYLVPRHYSGVSDEDSILEDYDSDETTMILQSRLSLV